MLIDDVIIAIKAGDGGNGSSHLKRNAQTAKGGPDGGNGGNGGDIYFEGTNDITALRQFQYKKRIQAETGISGGGQNMFGRNGKDTSIYVPFGTSITDVDTGKTYTITHFVPKILMATGGTGGRGNTEFKTAVHQTPTYAEKGTKGEERKLHLVLKLIADIGFIGLPNAGKSSLLKALTNANPKIGAYPFTTLEPNLGVMENILLADIPGLIEGASSGKGLGTKFLRHVERTKLLIHCIGSDNENPLESYETIRQEMEKFNPILIQKPEIILLTKTDLITEKELKKRMTLFKKFKKILLSVSIYNEESLQKLIGILKQTIKID